MEGIACSWKIDFRRAPEVFTITGKVDHVELHEQNIEAISSASAEIGKTAAQGERVRAAKFKTMHYACRNDLVCRVNNRMPDVEMASTGKCHESDNICETKRTTYFSGK